MSSIPRSTIKRLQRDCRQLQQEPLVGANAEPTDDLTLWNGVINVQLTVKGKKVVAPLHFRIDFPAQYPNVAPNVGFTNNFEYRMGASYTQPSGRLEGCKVICLDLLGNFAYIHTEWKDSEGSGWSPAYTVSTLLVNLQSVLIDLGDNMTKAKQQDLYDRCQAFAQKHPDCIPEVLTVDQLQKKSQTAKLSDAIMKIAAGRQGVVDKALRFVRGAGILDTEAKFNSFLDLLQDIGSSPKVTASSETNDSEVGGAAKVAKVEPVVDTNIVCYSTGQLYTEALLGYGISIQRRGRQVNLSTPAELLSAEAYDDGLRQSTSKAAFELFMPAFINPKHSCQDATWRRRIKETVLRLGKLYGCHTLEKAALSVFPKLINTMLVEIMDPQTSKSAAIAYFEALLSFWRTFHYLLKTFKLMNANCQRILRDFVNDEKHRLKSVVPDVGALFAMYACCPDGAPAFSDFVAAFTDEAFLRSSLFWRRNRTPLTSQAIFDATQIGRDIAMFQALFVRQLIGPDPRAAAAAMDASNGKLPDKLTKLQGFWRKHLETTKSWPVYFQRLGIHGSVGKPICENIEGWIQKLMRRAEARGSAYTGSRSNSGRRR